MVDPSLWTIFGILYSDIRVSSSYALVFFHCSETRHDLENTYLAPLTLVVYPDAM